MQEIYECMVTTIRGYYEEGRVVLIETPPIKTRTDVIVTFLSDDNKPQRLQKRIPGGLKGKVNIPDDFNDPLDELNEYQ